MDPVVEHRRDISRYLAECILADDGKRYSRRTDILLCSSVDEGVFRYIYRTAHDV